MRTARPLLTLAVAGAISVGLLASPASADVGDNFVQSVATVNQPIVERSNVMVVPNATDTVDNGNLAEAYNSPRCASCRAVAVAFQVVLVPGTPHTVKPGNLALATNDSCKDCVAVAIAKQQLIYTYGATGIDRDAQRRVSRIAAQVHAVAVSGGSPATIDAQLQPLWIDLVRTVQDGLENSRGGPASEREQAA